MENDHDLPADGADSAHDNAPEDPARPLSAEQALLNKWAAHFWLALEQTAGRGGREGERGGGVGAGEEMQFCS